MMTLHRLFISILPAVLVLISSCAAMAAGTETEEREYKLKAAFLFNFSKFTTWPEKTFTEAGQTFNFCVIGENPFGPALDQLETKKVGGRQVRLYHTASIAEAKTCHVMFISKSEQSHLAQLQKRTADRPVLTVSDIEGFSRQGGIFEFMTKDGRLSFIVNNRQAIHSRLQINASLLNLAVEVF